MADTELLSVNEYPTDGVRTSYDISFAGGYLSREHVAVTVFDSIDSEGNLINAYEPTFAWLGDYQISIVPAIVAGKTVRIYRSTPYTAPMVDFSDGSIINEATLDENAKQAVFLAAELRDRIGSGTDIARFYELLKEIDDAYDQAQETLEEAQEIVNGISDSLFANFSSVAVPSGLSTWRSRGHTTVGLGVATYISDDKATAALATACPNACKADAAGRYFRLLPTADGYVTPEQFGAQLYVAGVNQQPFIQQAVTYCKQAGCSGVYFPQPDYELWAPTRVATAGDGYNYLNDTGEYIVIDNFSCALIGRGGRRTKLRYKGPTGGSLLTDYQTVTVTSYGGECIWRGNAVKMKGNTSSSANPRPADSLLSTAVIRDIIFFSDAVGVKNTSWPAWPLSRDSTGVRQNCWDLSNKGIWFVPAQWSGDLLIENCDILGFLGEGIYTLGGYNSTVSAPSNNCRVTVRNCRVQDTNGQALNPNGPRSMDVDGFFADNCGVGIEGWMGYDYGRLANAYFANCGQTQLAGSYSYAQAMRVDNQMPTLGVSNVIFDTCGTVNMGGYVYGDYTTIDTAVAVLVQSAGMTIQNTKVDITAVCHKLASLQPIRYSNGYTAQSITNTDVHIHLKRSGYAQANSLYFGSLFGQAGSLGPNNYLYAKGNGFSGVGTSTATDNYVALIDEGLVLGFGGNLTPFDPSTTASPDWSTGFIRPSTWSAGVGFYSVNLPIATMYPVGAEITFSHVDSAATSWTEIIDPNASGEKKVLLGYRQTAKFKKNTFGRWDLVTRINPIAATAAVDIASTAATLESGPYSITLGAARPWHRATVTPAALVTGFVISAIRPEAGAVKFWVRNIDGGATLDPVSQNFTASVSV